MTGTAPLALALSLSGPATASGPFEARDDLIAPVSVTATARRVEDSPTDAPPTSTAPSAVQASDPQTEEPAPDDGRDLSDFVVVPVDDELIETEMAEGTTETVIVEQDPLMSLQSVSPLDAFEFAGGRKVILEEAARTRGATGVGESLERQPGVRSGGGGSGIGSEDTKLSVGVRGVNPRLSSRATVLLDGIPLAPAPYGQPQMSLFPVSVFSIDRIDAIRGGATARFGPQTSGGVFNLRSKQIPATPRLYAFTQGDSNLDFNLGAAYGGTHRGLGMYIEYAPRIGSSWRDHSDREIHSGMLKFSLRPTPKLELVSISHLYVEDSELPGGLTPELYAEDPFQSARPLDRFNGWRAGTGAYATYALPGEQRVKLIGYYSHTFRASRIAQTIGPTPEVVISMPRTFDVGGVEPRYSARLEGATVTQEISAGGRFTFESADLVRREEDLIADVTNEARSRSRLAAYAAYVQDELIFLDERLKLDLGARIEHVRLSRRDENTGEVISRNYTAPLPAASLWGEPVEGLALYLGYGRSFGPPQFLQLTIGQTEQDLQPERANSAELGLKFYELAGFYGEVTGWYKGFRDYLDIGENAIDNVGNTHAWGTEIDLEWEPGEVWDAVSGLGFYAGHAWTASRIIGGNNDGNVLPWYPVQEAWGGISYSTTVGFKAGVDLSYTGPQFTDLTNQIESSASGANGQIPDYFLMNMYARIRTPLGARTSFEATLGIKNLLDVRYFSRTDDRNAGILVQRPRTIYLNLGVAYDIPVAEQDRDARRQRRRERRDSARTQGPRTGELASTLTRAR